MAKSIFFLVALFFVSLFSLINCKIGTTSSGLPIYGYVIVANRGDPTVTFANIETDTVVFTINVTTTAYGGSPPVGAPELMYPQVYDKYLYIGDRNNKRVVIYEIDQLVNGQLPFVTSVYAGPGIFHMYVTPDRSQMWVINDLAPKGLTIFNPLPPFNQIYNLTAPPEVISSTASPHDVVFHPHQPWAYVGYQNLPGYADIVVKYSLNNFTELARADCGKIPHFNAIISPTAPETEWKLFVAAQSTLIDSLAVLDPDTLERDSTIIGMAGAHGIYGPSADGRTWYVSNLPGLGLDGIFAFDGFTYEVLIEATIDVPYNTPHNLVMTNDGKKMYLTHSGTNVDVTVWSIGDPEDARPKYITKYPSGLNAYGIWYHEQNFNFGESSGASSITGFIFSAISNYF